MATAGIYAHRRPSRTAAERNGQRLGLTGGLEVNRQQLTGNIGVTGLTTVLALLVAVWAIDRYVVDVPGVGGGQ